MPRTHLRQNRHPSTRSCPPPCQWLLPQTPSVHTPVPCLPPVHCRSHPSPLPSAARWRTVQAYRCPWPSPSGCTRGPPHSPVLQQPSLLPSCCRSRTSCCLTVSS